MYLAVILIASIVCFVYIINLRTYAILYIKLYLHSFLKSNPGFYIDNQFIKFCSLLVKFRIQVHIH